MQQEFAEYKKRNADEMEELREENSRLKRKIEVDKAAGKPYSTHSRVEVPPTEDESEYKPTGHTIQAETKKAAKELVASESNHPRERKQARFSNYAPLNAIKSRILDEVL